MTREFATAVMVTPKEGRGRSHGFTLVELMVSIAVLAILISLALPSFDEATLGGRLGSYANSLVASANLARGEAIKRNAQVAMCVSSNGSDCASSGGWEQGWIVFEPASGDVLARHQAAQTGLRIIAADGFTRLNFQPTGVGVTFQPTTPSNPTLIVCRATPNVGSQERVVSITAAGRAAVNRTTNAACS